MTSSKAYDVCLRSKLGNTWAGMGVAPRNRRSPGLEGVENWDSGLGKQTCRSCTLVRESLVKLSPDSLPRGVFWHLGSTAEVEWYANYLLQFTERLVEDTVPWAKGGEKAKS
jgi:hypothetical protein